MFQIPDWEDSVPSSDIKFDVTTSKYKSKNGSTNIDHAKNVDTKNNTIIQQNGLPKSNKKKNGNEIFSNGKTLNHKRPLSSNKQMEKNESPHKSDTHTNIMGRFVRLKPPNDLVEQMVGSKNPKSNNIKQKNKHNTMDNKRKSDKLKTMQTSPKQPLTKIKQKDVDLNESFDQSLDTDQLDEVIINAKKRKLNSFNNKEEKDVVEMFTQSSKPLSKKKEAIKNMLHKVGQRNTIHVNGNSLRERMLQRLKAAQFRYINEKLYTSSGSDAVRLFKEDPDAFKTYHQGYQQQVKKWPVNPIDLIVQRISKMPKTHFIADMGCGEAVLSKRVPQKVRSFDLVSFNSNVEVCDIAHTPLLASSMDVAVYCLALMGTDLTQYLVEANRVLKTGGYLLIAEVESRFDNVDTFIAEVQKIGFSLKTVDKNNQVFYFMEFTKIREAPKKSKLPHLTLKPCLYKKR
ncbi:ribosomal RNA-processing protein 8 [Pieris brassicae]|uniref:ribosomal RNA-processing protein 8 n=1 Tax=Pieris brassicae TaxID=7116 RepID=UPI001E65EE9B|nr:ribosomal RNA-processing protein 8 [Pieris brassicae]